jgi:hypothetical protein
MRRWEDSRSLSGDSPRAVVPQDRVVRLVLAARADAAAVAGAVPVRVVAGVTPVAVVRRRPDPRLGTKESRRGVAPFYLSDTNG